MSAQAPINAAGSESLVEALRALDRPVPATKLKRKGLNTKAVEAMLERLCETGLAHRWAKGRSVAYWHTAPQDYAVERAIAIAGQRAMDRKKLAAATAKACFGRLTTKVCETVIRDLTNSGQLVELPGPGGPKAKVVFAAGRTAAYIGMLADYLAPYLSRVGASPDALLPALQTAGRPSAAEQVMQALSSLQTEPGAHVAVRDLRRHPAVSSLSKSEFDAAVLQLADGMKVDLAAHDDVFHLTAEGREELVFERPNKYYVAIALRV